MNRTRAFESSVCIALLLAILFAGLGVWQIKPAQATSVFSDGFQSGDWSAFEGNVTSAAGNLAVQSTVKYAGTYAANVTMTSTAAWANCYLYENYTPTTTVYSQGAFYIDSFTSSNNIRGFIVHSSTLAGQIYAEIGINSSRYLYERYFLTNTSIIEDTSATQLSLDSWFTLELKTTVSNAGAGEVRVYLNNSEVGDLNNTGLTNLFGTSYLGCSWFGIEKGYSCAAMLYVDDITIADSYIGAKTLRLTVNSTPLSVPYTINGTDYGYTVYAASGGPSDLQTAIDTVHAQGNGTVYIPAGTFTFNWGSSKTGHKGWPVGVLSYGGVNIIGAGSNLTILQMTTPLSRNWLLPNVGQESMIEVDGSNGIPYRISGIKFQGYANVSCESCTAVMISCARSTDYRIDNCWFDTCYIGVFAFGVGYGDPAPNRGLVDHCNFTESYKNATFQTYGYGVWPYNYDSNQWSDIDDLLGQYYGTKDCMYVEDCWFNETRHAVTESQNGYFISRYNNFTNALPPNYGNIDVHGFNRGRGCEVYNNSVTGQVGYYAADAVWLRGGENTVFNNTFINCSRGIVLYNESAAFYQVKNSYFWSNNMTGGGTAFVNNAVEAYTENVTYFLYARPAYTAFIYPHPFTVNMAGVTNDTLMLDEDIYAITVQSQVVSGGSTYDFSKWQDDSTNTTFTVSLTANTTITATYTVYVIDTSGTVGVVGETGTYGYAAVEYAVQRKTFYANGRFWVFYFNGTLSANSTVYATSTDGLSWSSSVNMTNRTCGAGWRFAVTFNGTILSYAFSTSTNGDPLYYRAGTPNSDGTITWLDAEQNVTVGENLVSHLWPSIAIDSAGYPWIAYARKNATENSRYAYITTSSWTNGTWNTASGFPYKFSPYNYTGINTLVVPLTNQKVLAVGSNAGQHVMAYRWNGSSWGAEANTTSIIIDSGTIEISLSAVNQGDDVHLAFIKNGTRNLVHTKYAYASNSWGTETTIQSAVNETSSPVLSIDTSTNDLYCFWAGSPEANAIYYKRYNGTNWVFASDSNPWITETALAGYYKYDGLSGFYQTYDHKIGLAYTNGTTVYYVKFKYLNISTTFQVIITYPTNTTYTSSSVSVSLSASGTIDTIWWNCKNGTSWIYGTNQTYTVPTSMTGFVDGTSYTFYAWANNTDGDWDEETVMFTVLILYPDFGSWWGDWW